MSVTEPYSTVGPPFDPPPVKQFIGPLESAVRHPIATLLPLLAIVGVALAIGTSRAPTYTADTRISVGRVDVPAFTLQNVIAGNQALAASYSRAITARRVLLDAGRGLHLTPDVVAQRLYASPIPGSTLILVEAKGPSAREAAKLANAGARSLIAYVEHLQLSAQQDGLLAQYRRAQQTVSDRQSRLAALLAARASSGRVQQARVNLLTAQLKAQRLGALYNNSYDGPSPASPLQILALADSASSDATSVLERMLLVAAAAGLAVGLGLALALANGMRLRRRWA